MSYLYNGIELPALPEWDKEKYPYACITYLDQPYMKVGYLFVLSEINYGYSDTDVWGITTQSTDLVDSVNATDGVEGLAWELRDVSTQEAYQFIAVKGGLIWSNFDILNEDGTLYLAASDPIPVTAAPAPDPFWMTMGWMVGRMIAGMRGKKETADELTIRWNGEVTEPNYNEYYCRMTERIFTEEELTGAIAVFGGVEYTNTHLVANEPILPNNPEATEGFWLYATETAYSDLILISGKAGTWVVPNGWGHEFVLPADGTYFVRRYDTDGKYTESVTLPNAK